MAPLPVGKNQDPRTLLAEYAGDLQAILPGIFDAAVGEIERMAPGNFQDARRVRRFAGTVFGGAARPHLALREVEDSGAVSALGHLEQSSAAGLFYVVAVRGQGENVEGHKCVVGRSSLVVRRSGVAAYCVFRATPLNSRMAPTNDY